MNRLIRTLAGVSAVAATGAAASAAQASYFVQPYAQVDGTIDNGFEENGATAKSASVGSEASVSIDLDDGTVHSYLLRDQSIAGGTEFAQVVGIFGDRVTFYDGAGTDVDFSFAFDGNIFGEAADGSETLQFGAYASLYVFDASAGATSANFSSLGGELIKETWSRSFYNPESDIDEWIDDMLSGTITLGGSGSYDVFAFLNLSAVTNNNSSRVELDFSNTGTFGINTAPGVTYSSQSGVFLASTPALAVPEPASWALMIGGFAAAGGALRRKRMAMVHLSLL